VLDALRGEPHDGGAAQGLARALAARRLGRPDHVGKVPQSGYVNIDKTEIGGKTPAMVALLVHAVLAVVVIALVVRLNPAIFARVPASSRPPTLEMLYYVVGAASIPLCWYFNYRSV